MACIEVQDFTYTYPSENAPVVRDVTLSLSCGSFSVLTGRSGSGKSTLGKALAGFLFQDEAPNYQGKIIVNGTDMAAIPLYAASERVAYVQQNPEDQFCTLTVADEIAFGLENKNINPQEIKRRINASLAIVKGDDLLERDLANLSGGEKQKVAIASMLALLPDVLILDEPTSNLDPEATQNIFDALRHLQESQKMTVIIIEHKLTQLKDLHPELIVLENGKISPIDSIEAFQAMLEQEARELPTVITRDSRAEGHLIQIKNLSVHLGGHQILDDIHLTLKHGEFIAIMGPNGSGKSTLLQTIMGLIKPSSGTIRGFGQDLSKAKTSSLVEKIGFVFQNPDHQLFTNSVYDEAVLTLKNLDMLTPQMESQTRLWLKEMHLDERSDDHPQRLSYGEKRRLNLLAILLHHPKLLLIDEFLIGQDRHNAKRWMGYFRNYADQGHCVLLVNHHMELTQKFCDRIIFVDKGKILVDQMTEEAIPSIVERGFQAFVPQVSMEALYA